MGLLWNRVSAVIFSSGGYLDPMALRDLSSTDLLSFVVVLKFHSFLSPKTEKGKWHLLLSRMEDDCNCFVFESSLQIRSWPYYC